MLRQAMRIGVKEFFPQPIAEEEVRQALKSFRERYNPLLRTGVEKPCQVIDLIGCKGGIGTTSIAVNLAMELSRRKGGPSVALVDMNMLFGEISAFLDLKPSYHWGEISRNVERMDATFLSSIMTVHPSGIAYPGFPPTSGRTGEVEPGYGQTTAEPHEADVRSHYYRRREVP